MIQPEMFIGIVVAVGNLGAWKIIHSHVCDNISETKKDLRKEIAEVKERKAEADVCANRHRKIEQESAMHESKIDSLGQTINTVDNKLSRIDTKIDMILSGQVKL